MEYRLIITTIIVSSCNGFGWIDSSWSDLHMLKPEIAAVCVAQPVSFDYDLFPLSIDQRGHPSSGTFDAVKLFVIPDGRVTSVYGFVTIDDYFFSELNWKKMGHHHALLSKVSDNQVVHVSGRVAVIGQMAYFNYFHCIVEVMARLAALELSGLEYDWLHVDASIPFLQQMLDLFGVDHSKILPRSLLDRCIQADEIVVPTLVSNIDFGMKFFSCYVHPIVREYVCPKLLQAALQKNQDCSFSKKVFISRQDAAIRRVLNEDEVFSYFEKLGFVRYRLQDLSVVEQILLFHQAECIVSPQGTGLANSLFCTKDCLVVELFQGLNDATFWYLSQDCGYSYIPIQTTDFVSDYVSAWRSDTTMDLAVIKKLSQDLDNYCRFVASYNR